MIPKNDQKDILKKLILPFLLNSALVSHAFASGTIEDLNKNQIYNFVAGPTDKPVAPQTFPQSRIFVRVGGSPNQMVSTQDSSNFSGPLPAIMGFDCNSDGTTCIYDDYNVSCLINNIFGSGSTSGFTRNCKVNGIDQPSMTFYTEGYSAPD